MTTDENAVPDFTKVDLSDLIGEPEVSPEDSLRFHKAASAIWLGNIERCLYENWPDAMKAISFHTETMEVTAEDQCVIMNLMDHKPDDGAGALAAKISEAIEGVSPDGCFVRLSSRSPKDTFGDTPTRYRTGSQVLESFMWSMRVMEDLIEYRYAETECHMLFREYESIPEWEEFRCFVIGGEIAGISQYYYADRFEQLQGAEGLAMKERVFAFARSILPILHMETVVVDVWVGEHPKLIEINPYGLSDPCCLRYAELVGAKDLYRVRERKSSRDDQ